MNSYIYNVIFNCGVKIVGYENDSICLVYLSGNKYWHMSGKQHRTNGPAIELANGNKSWFLNGKLHREDGPAIEYTHGSKHWYLNDKGYTEEEFNTTQSTKKK